MRIPEPSKRPLGRQAEIACVATMSTGVGLLLGSQVTTGELSRQLLIGASACIVTVGGPLVYQIVQGLRWLRRTAP